MKENAGKKLIKLFLGFSMASWLSAAINFFIVPVITRVIEPGELGQIDMFVTFCSMFIYASTLGMHQSYMRFFNDLPEGFAHQSLLSYSVKVSTVGALLSGIICFIGIDYFSISILGERSIIISVCMVIYILANGFLDVIKTKPRMFGNALQYTLIVVLISICTKIAYLSYGYNQSVLKTIEMITVVSVILMICYLAVNISDVFSRTHTIPVKSKVNILKYALPTVPIMFISNMNTSIPKLLLNKFCDNETVGIYAGALTLVSIITLVQAGINVFWSPYVFANYKEKQEEIQKVHLVISFVIVLCGLGLVLFQDIIFLILGDSYRVSKGFYALLLASPIFYTIGETIGAGINIERKTYWNIVTTGSALLVNVVIGYIVVPRYGNVGAAISVMLSAVVMLVLKAVIGERYYKVICHPLKTWSSVVVYVSGASLSALLSDNNVLRCISVIVIMIIYIMIYNKEVKACFNMVKSYVRR